MKQGYRKQNMPNGHCQWALPIVDLSTPNSSSISELQLGQQLPRRQQLVSFTLIASETGSEQHSLCGMHCSPACSEAMRDSHCTANIFYLLIIYVWWTFPVQFSSVQFSSVQFSSVQISLVQFSEEQCQAAKCNTMHIPC